MLFPGAGGYWWRLVHRDTVAAAFKRSATGDQPNVKFSNSPGKESLGGYLRVYGRDNTLVVEAAGKDPAKAAIQIVAGLTPADIQKWSGGSPADWAQESYNVAKEVTYSFAKDKPTGAAAKYNFATRKGEKDPCGPVPLYHVEAGYRERAVAAVKEQLAKGGVRLAFLLRENLQ